jgi:hypothetical protein
MAIDFPSSPTPGQQFQGYLWDDSKNAWRSVPTNRGSVITSATTPTGASPGDMWFNSSDGSMFVYYDDGITTQWVEIQANFDNYKTPSQNYVINGAFDFWQRGTSVSTGSATTYTSDRWRAGRSSNVSGVTVSRQASTVPDNFKYSAKIQRDSGNTATNAIRVTHNFENAGIELAGKKATLSFYLRVGAEFSNSSMSISVTTSSVAPESVIYSSGGGFNSGNADLFSSSTSISPTETYVRYSYTVDVPTTANAMQIVFAYSPTGTAGSNDSFYLAGVQLEEGTIATPFRRNQASIQAELAACQRYYEKSYDIETTPGTVTEVGAHRHSGSGNATGRHYVPIRFKVEKRTNSYEVNTYNPTATNASWITQNSAQAGLARTPLVENKSTSGMVLNVEDGGYAWAVGNTRGHWAVADEL